MRLGLLALAAGLAGCGVCSPVLGPEAEVGLALRDLERGRARIEVGGRGALEVTSARLEHLLVKPEGEGLVAVTQVDAEAVFAGTTAISYIGLERVPFSASPSGVRPRGPLLPALAQVVELLLERDAAVTRSDLKAVEALTAHGYDGGEEARAAALAAVARRLGQAPPRARSWTIRVERESAELLEDLGPDAGRVRLRLAREGGRFRFAAGLR